MKREGMEKQEGKKPTKEAELRVERIVFGPRKSAACTPCCAEGGRRLVVEGVSRSAT
jgi:hypothetical protein